MLDRLRVRKPLIVAGAAAQAAAWLPLLLLPALFPSYGPWLLLAGAVLYFVAGHLTVPAWNSVMTEMVDADRRGRYFARRARVIAVTSFLALAAGGLVLHLAEAWRHPVWGFVIVFLATAVARAASALYLARLPECPVEQRRSDRGLRDFLRSRRSLMFRRFLMFSGAFHVAAMMAGPFFVVYLLRDLQLTYLQYTVWLVGPIVGQCITLRQWGHIADMFGNKRVLAVTGLMIPLLPMLYLGTTNWMALVGVNLLSGVIWPGFSLSLGNYVFDVVQPAERAKGVAVYHTVNAAGAALGAMLGSWLARIAPSQVVVWGGTLGLVSNLPVVFFLSGACRLLVALTLLGTFRERRRVVAISPRAFMAELPLIKPLTAAIGIKVGRTT
jgi:MFS family permease